MMRSSKGCSMAIYLIMRTLWSTSFIKLTRLSRALICQIERLVMGAESTRRKTHQLVLDVSECGRGVVVEREKEHRDADPDKGRVSE